MSNQYVESAVSRAAEPSAEAWSDILEYLMGAADDGVDPEGIRGRLERSLEAWPLALRRAHIEVKSEEEYLDQAIGWDAATYGPAIGPWLPLVRTLVATPEDVLGQPDDGVWARWGFRAIERWEVTSVRRLESVSDAASRLPGLQTLSLRRVASATGRWPRGVGRDWPSFFQQVGLRRVPHLDLAGLPIGAAGCKALIASPLAHSVASLDLSDTNLRNHGVTALAEWPRPSRLTAIDISGNHAGSAALIRFVQSPILRTLTELAIGGNDLTDDVAAALSAPDAGTTLRVLDCSGANLTDDTAAILGAAAGLTHLEVLRLGNNALRDAGLARLLAAPLTDHLVELDLSENKLTNHAADILTARPVPRCLQRLFLHGNRLSAAAWQAIDQWAHPSARLVIRRSSPPVL